MGVHIRLSDSTVVELTSRWFLVTVCQVTDILLPDVLPAHSVLLGWRLAKDLIDCNDGYRHLDKFD